MILVKTMTYVLTSTDISSNYDICFDFQYDVKSKLFEEEKNSIHVKSLTN